MSNSNLVSYIDTTTMNWSNRIYPISRITIHHAAGVMTMKSFSNILRNTNRECSWNYAIANDGTIGLFVDESHRAWTSSSRENDQRAVTIEVSNSSTGGDWPVSDAAYQSLLNLCEDICRRNSINKLTYTGQLQGSNLTMHQWFAPTLCPGPYLKSKFPDIAYTVNSRLNSESKLTYVTNFTHSSDSAYDFAKYGTNNITGTIDINKLHKYIVTIDRHTKAVNYTALKSIGVSGVVIEAGYLYDALHIEHPYRNPNLLKQTEAVLGAGLNYGLYCDVRSRSIDEAMQELYHLSLCLRKYSPYFGMWLRLRLGSNKSINHQIIDLYYKQLVDLGLKNKIGFYVTKSELLNIDWNRYKDDWYLWIDSHIDSMNNIDELLTPQFFVI